MFCQHTSGVTPRLRLAQKNDITGFGFLLEFSRLELVNVHQSLINSEMPFWSLAQT
jgi:hypothetical protein